MVQQYAVIIGNSLYKDLSQLTAPVLDARAMVRVLADPVIGDYICQLELNQESQRLRQVIEDLFVHKAKKDDTALIYFSGHGLINDLGELHLATKDTDQKYLQATSISAEFIRRVMDQCNAERKIVILDSCHSGAFTNGLKGEEGLGIARRARWEFGRGVAILTASRELQYAFEIPGLQEQRRGGLSIFTHFLVTGLETGAAAKEKKEVISVNDLFAYVEASMLASNIRQQKPQISTIKQEGEIIIANNPGSPKFALPESVTRLLQSSQRVELQQAIDLLRQYTKGENEFWARQAISKLQELSQHSSLMIQALASSALSEANRGLRAPAIRFSSGELINSVAKWVSLIEQDKHKWPEAAEFLYSGLLAEWLSHINCPDLANIAKKISAQLKRDRLAGLEQFQRIAGSLPPQSKIDAVTNLDDLLGQLIYWRLRRQRGPRDFQFEITNQGRGYLHGQLTPKVGWISLKQPHFGCLPQETAEVTLTVEPDKYKPYKIYGFPLDFRLD